MSIRRDIIDDKILRVTIVTRPGSIDKDGFISASISVVK